MKKAIKPKHVDRRRQLHHIGGIDPGRIDAIRLQQFQAAFPREHWTRIASKNPLERVNREVEPRADVIGIFPNDDYLL